jgi:hypothetical protein
VNKVNFHSAGLLARWLLNLLRFLFAAGLTLFLHVQLFILACWVVDQTTPPNVSPDAGQPWMDRHYVPAYADYSTNYAAGILLAGSGATALVLYMLGRKQLLVERWAVGAVWLVAMLGELLVLPYMHTW